MNIQWYPGHMTKTRRQIEADLKHVDIVAEIIDARIPISSRNPDIDAICADKPRLIVLNRADQADPAQNRAWGEYFDEKDMRCWRLMPRPAGCKPVLLCDPGSAEGADLKMAGEGPGRPSGAGHGGGSPQRGKVHLYQ